jgi:hypothetical protein
MHSFSTAVVSSNDKVVFFASLHDAVNAIVITVSRYAKIVALFNFLVP